MSKAQRKSVDAVITAMRARPQTFSARECVLQDHVAHIEYWIGNGAMFYGIHKPYTMRFGLLHGWRFGRALTAWKAAMQIHATSRNEAVSRGDQ